MSQLMFLELPRLRFFCRWTRFIGSERRTEPRDPTRKLKLPIVRSISWSKFVKTGARVGECCWKSTAPKVIWFSSIFELLFKKSEKVVKFMIPTPKVPTVDANWRGLTRQMS
jgi:hypothetical protein